MVNRGPALVAVATISLLFTWLSCFGRALVRVKLTRRLWFDDYMLLVSMVLFNIFVALVLTSAYWGVGRHIHDPEIGSLKNAFHAWFYADILYTVCIGLFRIAAAEHLMRHVRRSWQRWVVYAFAWVNILFTIYMVIVLIFRCRPINYFWDRLDSAGNTMEGECHLRLSRVSFLFQSAWGATIDIILATMPVLILKDVKVAHCQKTAIFAVVAFAQLAPISMMVKIPASEALRAGGDWSWAATDVAIWSMIEPAVGILALCLATFAPVMGYLWPTSTRQIARSRRNRSHHNSSNPFYHRDYASEAGLHGIPLENTYGNKTRVETGMPRSSTSSETKNKSPSDEYIEGAGQKWDMGIVKTTELYTTSSTNIPRQLDIVEEEVGTQKIARPQSILKR
ncbi:hypothetical protein BT63DRAFT_465962 [Microthyrium microscopicum]|uniref:Rhodopsin domain-containing protein n=1 Tax=Microthyrium microscopicum TaxID=703497 RepID=A0A6A6TTK8_9PEZI|nr:hypothetical protein BT63DRAFT_465962 [Microthyrium microscopicum]